MFNSDFFKSEEARFARIKSPVEIVVGTLRIAGGLEVPSVDAYDAAKVCSYMGQDLLNPPSVEGWQGGSEWINTGAYVERINYASKALGDANKPGLRSIIDRIKDATDGSPMSAERLVDLCLDLVGPVPVLENTRKGLVDHARTWGDLDFDTDEARAQAEKNIVAMLQLVVATQEYQLV